MPRVAAGSPSQSGKLGQRGLARWGPAHGAAPLQALVKLLLLSYSKMAHAPMGFRLLLPGEKPAAPLQVPEHLPGNGGGGGEGVSHLWGIQQGAQLH